jgi:molybdenum cofactor guanylyltransferase
VTLIVGIFVGGQGTRLGGVAKGLLRAPSSEQTLVERLLTLLPPNAEAVLVGAADAYRHLGVPSLPDEPAGIGPLGGLIALLAHAERRGAATVLALACDLPRLSAELVERLARELPGASALVTEQDGVKNPLIARYSPAAALATARAVHASGKRSLQAVLDQLGDVRTLSLTTAELETLGDWDTPEDLRS